MDVVAFSGHPFGQSARDFSPGKRCRDRQPCAGLRARVLAWFSRAVSRPRPAGAYGGVLRVAGGSSIGPYGHSKLAVEKCLAEEP